MLPNIYSANFAEWNISKFLNDRDILPNDRDILLPNDRDILLPNVMTQQEGVPVIKLTNFNIIDDVSSL